MQKQMKARSVCSRIGLALFATMAILQLGVVGMMLLAQAFAPRLVYSEAGIWLLNDIAIYALGLPVFLLILHFIPDGPAEQGQPRFHMNVGRFLVILLVCFGLAYTSSFITNLLTGFALEEGALSNLAEASLLVRVFFGAVVPAFGEEFMFRYMLRRKLRGAGDKIYILFSALCFGLFHGTLTQLLYAFAVGVVFAWVYSQTGVIWYSVVMHFLFNCMSLVVVQSALDYYGALILIGLFVIAAIIASIAILAVNGKRIWRSLQPPSQPGWPYNMPKYPSYGAPNGVAGYPNAPSPYYTAQYSPGQYPATPPYAGQPYIQPGYSQPVHSGPGYPQYTHQPGYPPVTQPGYPAPQPAGAQVPPQAQYAPQPPYGAAQPTYGTVQPAYGTAQHGTTQPPYAVAQPPYAEPQPVKPYKYAYSNDSRTNGYTNPAGQQGNTPAPVHGPGTGPRQGSVYAAQPGPYGVPAAAAMAAGQKPALFPPAPLPQFPYSGPGALRVCLLNLGVILFALASVAMILLGLLL